MRLVLLLFGLATAGCAASRVSMTPAAVTAHAAVNTVAIAPGSGPLAEAIGVELFNAGVTIVDASQVGEIVGRVGLKEFEVTSSSGLAALREKGIDAVLVAKAVDGQDGRPESASVRVTETSGGQMVAGATWQNGWGGRAGSIADRTMRKNLSGAAKEIATTLIPQLRPGAKK